VESREQARRRCDGDLADASIRPRAEIDSRELRGGVTEVASTAHATAQRKTGNLVWTVVGAALALAILGGIAGYAIYRERVAPFRTTVLIVDDDAIDVDYLLKRALMSDQEPLSVLQAITLEEIVKRVMPKPPYNMDVTEADIDASLRRDAQGKSESISDEEYAEWYRQQLNDSRLSDAEFRDLTRARLLIDGLEQYLTERLPSVAEQVHLHMIVESTSRAAAEAKAKLDSGTDFAELARTLKAEARPGGAPGDLGWYVRAELDAQIAALAFDKLRVGAASDPLPLAEQSYVVLMVSEKAAARPVDEDAKTAMKEAAVRDWFRTEFRNHKVEYHGFTNGYDSETDAWIKGQLQKMKSAAGSAS
jgi:parvulin-like peptidyl-prolyl isomerase